MMGSFAYKYTGFEMVSGKGANENPTRRDYRPEVGKRHHSTVKVRNDGLQAYLNGDLVGEWKGNYKS